MTGRRIVALVLVAMATVTLTGCDPAEARRVCEQRGGRMVDELVQVPRYGPDAKGHLRLLGWTTQTRAKCRGAK